MPGCATAAGRLAYLIAGDARRQEAWGLAAWSFGSMVTPVDGFPSIVHIPVPQLRVTDSVTSFPNDDQLGAGRQSTTGGEGRDVSLVGPTGGKRKLPRKE